MFLSTRFPVRAVRLWLRSCIPNRRGRRLYAASGKQWAPLRTGTELLTRIQATGITGELGRILSCLGSGNRLSCANARAGPGQREHLLTSLATELASPVQHLLDLIGQPCFLVILLGQTEDSRQQITQLDRTRIVGNRPVKRGTSGALTPSESKR